MNSIFKSLSITALLLFGVSAYAEDKIVITGEPIVLEQQEGVYHVPADYTATTTYHYVMVSRPRALPPRPLAEPDVILSHHPAPIKSTHRTYLRANGQKAQAFLYGFVPLICLLWFCFCPMFYTSSLPRPTTCY